MVSQVDDDVQRFHWYVMRVGVFVHVPSLVRSRFPMLVGPERSGGVTFTGGGGGAGFGATKAEAAEVAVD